MTDDELRNILGDDLYTELSNLEKRFDQSCGRTPVTPNGLDANQMRDRVFHIVLPMPGVIGMALASKYMHAGEDCESCADDLAGFTSLIVSVIWNAMCEAEWRLQHGE